MGTVYNIYRTYQGNHFVLAYFKGISVTDKSINWLSNHCSNQLNNHFKNYLLRTKT